MPDVATFIPIDGTVTATIALSGTISSAIDLAGCRAVGLITPGTLTSTTVTFYAASAVDGTYAPIYDDTNTAYVLTVGTVQARAYALRPDVMAPWRFVKAVTGGTESAERALTLIARPI